MTLSMNDNLQSWVETEYGRHPIRNHAYFDHLNSDACSLEAFVHSQKQFFFAVRYFSRPMAALTSRMTRSAQRQGLVHNLAEEHGYEDSAGFTSRSSRLAHDLTFTVFLDRLGVPPETMTNLSEGVEVRAFNTSLMGTCMMEPVPLAFACMGVIERAFADISLRIGQAVVQRGWIQKGQLIHYNVHAEIDHRHAADFFDAVSEDWDRAGEGREQIQDGVRLGLHLFNRLYDDLLALGDSVSQ